MTSSASFSGRPSSGGTRRIENTEAVTSAPLTGAALPSSEMTLCGPVRKAPRSSKEASSLRHSGRSRSGSATGRDRLRSQIRTITMSSPSSTGSGLLNESRMWSGNNPTGIPIASAKTATSVRAGCLKSMRSASFTSSQEAPGNRRPRHHVVSADPSAFIASPIGEQRGPGGAGVGHRPPGTRCFNSSNQLRTTVILPSAASVLNGRIVTKPSPPERTS